MLKIACVFFVLALTGCGVKISPDPGFHASEASFMATTSAVSPPNPPPERIYRAIARQCDIPLEQAKSLEVHGGGLVTYRFYLFTCPYRGGIE